MITSITPIQLTEKWPKNCISCISIILLHYCYEYLILCAEGSKKSAQDRNLLKFRETTLIGLVPPSISHSFSFLSGVFALVVYKEGKEGSCRTLSLSRFVAIKIVIFVGDDLIFVRELLQQIYSDIKYQA